MTDKLLRWKLRVQSQLRGDAHPFVVTEPLLVHLGATTHAVPYVRELPIEPYAVPWGHER